MTDGVKGILVYCAMWVGVGLLLVLLVLSRLHSEQQAQKSFLLQPAVEITGGIKARAGRVHDLDVLVVEYRSVETIPGTCEAVTTRVDGTVEVVPGLRFVCPQAAEK